MWQRTGLETQIPSVKFYPPHVSSSQFLYRQRIIDQLLPLDNRQFPTVIIEAQAGQGKTTTIKQFINRTSLPSIWYQVGPEDADPVFFLQSLIAGIKNHLPDFPPVATSQKLMESDFTLLTLQQRIKLLFNDLDSVLSEDLYIIFDDLHYLTANESDHILINCLVEVAPARLHFILASREPLLLTNEKKISRKRKLVRIDNRDLALDEVEVSDFFQKTFNCDLSQHDSQKIARSTDGWVMGILLLARQMKQQAIDCSQPLPTNFKATNRQELYHYFRDEIFSHFEARLHQPLLRLSLLEVIPVELAIEITGEHTIGNDLYELARRNYFVRHLDSDNARFGLHHLFQQYLQEKALTELPMKIIRSTYQQAGKFCQQSGNSASALRYLLKADDYNGVEALLKSTGMDFLSTNQSTTLAIILQEIPQHSLKDQGWSSLFLALSTLDSAPSQALPLLYQALHIFHTQHDEVGELLSLAHIISIHITTTGHYRDGEQLLERAEQLFFQTAATLDPPRTILIARSLGMGHCILRADSDQATKFGSLALNLAREEKLVNFEAALLMMMGYIQIFAGHTSLAQMYLEQAAPYIHHPEVGSFNRLSIRMMLFNFLFNEGDFLNYFEQKKQLFETIGNTIISQSIAGPFCYVWEMDIAINRGDFDKAVELADQALAHHPPLSPHLHSLILQQKGLVLAQSQHHQAIEQIEKSQQLRQLSGGPFFVTLNKIVAGLTYAQCDHHDQALTLLDEGIQHARQIPTKYLEATGLLHRAAVYLRLNDEQRAQRDIAAGLELMRHNRYRHIWAWTPAAIKKTLSFAVTHNIEVAYARTLAAHHLSSDLLENDTAAPLLEIRTLGCFKICYHGSAIMQAEDLTPTQRELLCLLFTSPKLKIPQETIQLHFWPDSAADTAKTKLDTLISRLRKILGQSLPENGAHCYLKREKGLVWLAHCRIDALDFLNYVNRGLRHLRLQENWQAGNDFHTAYTLWRGEFASGVSGEEQISSFRQQLANTYSELAHAWSGLLVNSERLTTAIKLVEKALVYSPLNDTLYALLYRLQGKNSAVQARRVLQQYNDLLHAEGYPAEEITELLTSITNNP